MNSRTYKGQFKPKNPSKYVGDCNNIIYRSSWELKFMTYCDKHPDILKWASEELAIPYRSPVDGKVHRYFPDFLVRKRNRSGQIETVLIEVKPFKQTRPPEKKSKVTKRYLAEARTWAINSEKWRAARNYCENKNWKFMIMTENELGIK